MNELKEILSALKKVPAPVWVGFFVFACIFLFIGPSLMNMWASLAYSLSRVVQIVRPWLIGMCLVGALVWFFTKKRN